MSFSLVDTKKFSLSHIEKQFSAFESCDRLPFCCIKFCERPQDMLKNKTPVRRVGGHNFYLLDDGVMVTNPTTFAVIRDNYSLMEVYLPTVVDVPETHTAFLMLQAYRYALANAGHFQMHSAVVIHNGYGIAFCGTPGAGKSTQAHLWEKHLDAEALNLDQPCILFEEDKVLISGSPWSGKEDCYKNKAVELKAIFFVEQAPTNETEKLSVAESFSHLFLNNFLVPINEEIEKKHHNAVLKLASSVPAYRLKCTISEEAVKVALEAAFNEKED